MPVKIVNLIMKILRIRPKLDLETIMKAASKESGGLTDLGQFARQEFDSLAVALLNSFDKEAHLTPLGRYLTQNNLARIFSNRIMVEDLYKRFPEIEMEEISAPVVVSGAPRTGTTLLFRLLAKDPKFQFVPTWECFWPAPSKECFEAASQSKRDPRILKMEQTIKFVDWIMPHYRVLFSIYLSFFQLD